MGKLGALFEAKTDSATVIAIEEQPTVSVKREGCRTPELRVGSGPKARPPDSIPGVHAPQERDAWSFSFAAWPHAQRASVAKPLGQRRCAEISSAYPVGETPTPVRISHPPGIESWVAAGNGGGEGGKVGRPSFSDQA